jgi:predicted AAA+ superfamily ATPase
MTRRRTDQIIKDLKSKIVFLTGPRQVGKTWLARDIAGKYSHPLYLNYDSRADREIIEKEAWLASTDLIIFDEIHKMPGWKTYIKGIFDTRPEKLQILVTGSARLEYFRQTGDSLSGRFFTHRLFPFSSGELAAAGAPPDLDRLITRGGFPEPYLAEEAPSEDGAPSVDGEAFARRWRKQYVDGLIREDVLDFEKFSDFKSLKLCLELLRSRVGSPVSYSSMARDIGIAPNTVKKYIQVFQELYIIFPVSPFSENIARSLLKEPKIYFFDTALVDGDEGIKFENLVALALAKQAAAEEDINGNSAALHYIRTKDGREVDFCYVRDGKAQYLLEAKLSDSSISKNLHYFCGRYNIPGIQLVKNLKHERQEGIEVRSASAWLAELE